MDGLVQAKPAGGQAGRHALVIGGSLAGLLAARVLADHFGQVTVIERDIYPEQVGPRKGVPQGRHLHVFLMRGRKLFEQLFPGLGSDLIEAGAPVMKVPSEFAWCGPNGWGPRFDSPLTLLTCSRELLDWRVRSHLAAIPNISFLQQHAVTGLLADASGTTIRGVRVVARTNVADTPLEQEPGGHELTGDLIVDASGRTSQTPQWLEQLGYGRAQESIVNSHLGYASRWYRIPTGFRATWKGILISARPPAVPLQGGLFPQEGNRWLVTLAGAARDYPPIDEAGYLEFMQRLPSPILYNVLKDAEPLTSIHGYRQTENRMVHYERMKHWPEHFLVSGDAACAFNPVYAQGMTVAAIDTLLLDRLLHEQQRRTPGTLEGLGQQFQQRLAKSNAIPWLMATGEDFRYPTTEGGKRGLATRFSHWYMDQVGELSATDPELYLEFLQVIQMLKSPLVLYRPALFSKIMAYTLSGSKYRGAPVESWQTAIEGTGA